MIVQDIFEGAIALIDGLNPDTGLVDPDTTKDYAARTPKLMNGILAELTKLSKITKKYEISVKPIENLLGGGFEVYEHNEDFELDCDGSAKAYYFECDGTGTAYIDDFTGSWNTISTINLTELTSGYKAYKGIVTPTTGATKSRIRFTGPYYYKVINVALFKQSFSSAAKVPNYQPRFEVNLPSDVDIIESVIEESNYGYEKGSHYSIEANGTTQQLFVDYYFTGKLRVLYKPVPATITSLADTVELDNTTANAAKYALAEAFVNVEQNEFLTKLFNSKYNNAKATAFIKSPKQAESITNVYGTI